MTSPRLNGFDDPQYQRDAAGLAAAGSNFDTAYHAKLAELTVQAIKDRIPLDKLPPEVRGVVEAARAADDLVDVSDIPANLRPFYTVAKILLALLA